MEITHIEPVGSYAIQLTFSDGHNTGIYSWDLLHNYGLHQEEMWQHYLKRLDRRSQPSITFGSLPVAPQLAFHL